MKQDWETKKLGDVFSLEYGKPLPKDRRIPDGLYPVYGANGIINRTNEFYVGEPSIIVGRKGSAGEINYTESKFWPLDVTYYVKFSKEKLNIDFLYHLLNFLELPKLAKGVKPGINRNDVYAITSKIPPLHEQECIIAKLDQCFEAIDKSRANVEQNLKNTKELFQSQLNQIFVQKGDGWVEKKLSEICSVLNGHAFKSKDSVVSSNIQLLRMGNLYQNRLDLSRKSVYYPDSFANEYKKYLLMPDDLVMSLTGTVDKKDYGYTVEIPKTSVNLLLNQRIMKINILDSDVLLKSYLHNYLLSPLFLEKLYATAHGTRQANLSSKTILTLKIPFPILVHAQKKIVQKLEELKEQIQSLESRYQQKLEALDELNKSILQKAFSGELITIPKEATI